MSTAIILLHYPACHVQHGAARWEDKGSLVASNMQVAFAWGRGSRSLAGLSADAVQPPLPAPRFPDSLRGTAPVSRMERATPAEG